VSDAPPIRYVSPVFGDDVRASGFQFACPRCGWRSPVMNYRLGASRHESEHDCAATKERDPAPV
jgi:hypothetical protein